MYSSNVGCRGRRLAENSLRYSALDDAARGKALAAWHAEWQAWVAWVAGNFTTTA